MSIRAGWRLRPSGRKIGHRRRQARPPRLRSRTRSSRRLVLEPLEARVVLDARLLITEFLASNDQGLEDENRDTSDWIEIHNAGDASADLDGWHLTDNATQLAKWTFPAMMLGPDQYLVVFASGKNRVDPEQPLHTNFQLGASGEYLALVQPSGRTAVSQFAPQFPAQRPDASYGTPQGISDEIVVGTDSEVRVFVPTAENGGDQLDLTWTQLGFDDADWMSGIGAVGFEGGTGYQDLIGMDVESVMFNTTTSAFIRYPFVVQDKSPIFSLKLRAKYDDGYVAYLNGVEVARRNALDPLTWNSTASANHRDSDAVAFEDVDLTAVRSLLQEGENLLAIHGLNRVQRSNDFLVLVELHAAQPEAIESTSGRYFAQPSPGGPNGLVSYSGVVEEVRLSVERGFYEQPVDVQISTQTPGATLVYTTDGSPPSLTRGIQILSPGPNLAPSATLEVDRTVTLRVRAFKDDFVPSKTVTHSYLLAEDILSQDVQATLDAGFPETWRGVEPDYGMDPDVVGPEDKYQGEFAGQILESLRSVPSISIVMEMDDLFGETTGIYTNSAQSGAAWERPTSVELIDPSGGEEFQIHAGIRIQGDNVRNLSNSKKQSFRLEFREQYGPTKLRFPLFGEGAADSFDTIILRGQYNDGWVHTPGSTQYIRDQWARSTQLAMGHASAHGHFMHVYLNGFYWGLYNVVERPEASFSATYDGGDKEQWDTLNTGQIRSGTTEAWNDLRSLARDANTSNQATSNAALLRLLGRNPDGTDNPAWEVLLDIDNYIDYLILNFYGGNVDWPGRNYYAGRQRGPESTGFKFYAWDTEKILDHGEGSTLQTDRTSVREGAAQFYYALVANDEFRLMFADHLQRHFSEGGVFYVDPNQPQWDPAHPERNRPAARYVELAEQVELALIGESARWGDTQSTSTRNDGLTYTLRNWRARRDRLLANYFPRRSAIVLGQFVKADLYPSIAAPVFSQHGGSIRPGFRLSLEGPGPIYFTLDGTDPRQSALLTGITTPGIAPEARTYSGPIAIEENTIVMARTLIDGQWSALNEATFTAMPLPLRISEIMYHPRDPEGGGTMDDDDFEFVELVNTSPTEPVDLAGIRFTQGIEFTFPEMTLAPGQRVVVVRNLLGFQQRYETGIVVAGEYGNTPEGRRLSNAGETLRLESALGQVIHEFTYDDSWIPTTDGQGNSLTVINFTADLATWNDRQSWRASRWRDGSPGQDDAADLNGDQRLDTVDLAVFSAGFRANDLGFDVTRDGLLDQVDVTFFVTSMFGIGFGDANLDGIFNSRDLVQVFQAGEYEDSVPENSTWTEGDWNLDGEFNSSDLVLALQRGNYLARAVVAGPNGAAVPALAAAVVQPQDSGQAGPFQPEVPSRIAPRKPQEDGRPTLRSQPERARQLIFTDPHTAWTQRSVNDCDDRLTHSVASALDDPDDD